MKAIKAGDIEKDGLLELLNQKLTCKSERALFGLLENPEDFFVWLHDGAPGCKL